MSLQITKLLNRLKDLGSAKSTKTFDFCGKLVGLSGKKTIEKHRSPLAVSEATFVDETGGKVAVGVWNKAIQFFDYLYIGTGVAVTGCNAQIQDGEVKLSIWHGAHISVTGEQAQSFTDLNFQSAKKVRRLVSEPKSPAHSQ